MICTTGFYLGPSLIFWASVALGHQNAAPHSSQSRSTTSSISRETLVSLPCTPAAPPLENDDLLAEILLRLPLLPSSLPRASAVSRRWRSLASDPRFSCRFRAHHCRNPPLLGCFVRTVSKDYFQSTLEAPNRVPESRFTLPIAAGDDFLPLGCRHGLFLVFMFRSSPKHLLVWEPVTGDQHRLDIPPGIHTERNSISAAVLRTVGDVQHFEVVLVGNSDMQHTQPVASVYSSETGVWGNLITAMLPSKTPTSDLPTSCCFDKPALMVRDSLYWLLTGKLHSILEYDLARRSLSLIPMPADDTHGPGNHNFWLMTAEGGGLGFLFLTSFCAHLWNRKKDRDGVASWVLGRSIQLDKLLPLNPENKRMRPAIIGFAEDNNALLVWTSIGIFTVQLESLQFKKVFESECWNYFYPFEAVYTAGKGISGGHDEAQLLQNT